MNIRSILSYGSFALALSASPAFAGGCGSSCYQKVVTPAEYGTVAETVQVRAARAVRHVTPAEYGSVAETVVVRPAQTVGRVIPAVVQTVAEQVMVSPGGKQWQVSRDHYGREIGCWVQIPARYAVRHRSVIVQPERVVHETIPAVTAVRERAVMIRPAQEHHSVIPAEYATQHRQVLVRPASASWQPIQGMQRVHYGY